MPRSRDIKPGIMTNEQLGELQPINRLLFIYMWMICDREGRMEDRPKQIVAKTLPFDSVDAESLIKALAEVNLITRYEVNKKKYIQIVSFQKYQRPHIHETPSKIPPPPENDETLDDKVSYLHGANTVFVPCKYSASTVHAPNLHPLWLNHGALVSLSAMKKHTSANATVCKKNPSQAPESSLPKKQPAQKLTKTKKSSGSDEVSFAEMRKTFPDLDEQTVRDWLTTRKHKGAKKLTRTAWNRVVNEIKKIGCSGQEAILCAAENEWRGFKADWYFNDKLINRSFHEKHKPYFEDEFNSQLMGEDRNDW